MADSKRNRENSQVRQISTSPVRGAWWCCGSYRLIVSHRLQPKRFRVDETAVK